MRLSSIGKNLVPSDGEDNRESVFEQLFTLSQLYFRRLDPNPNLNCLQKLVPDILLKTAFHALIKSYVFYAILCWGHAPAENQMFHPQKKTLRIVSGVSEMT